MSCWRSSLNPGRQTQVGPCREAGGNKGPVLLPARAEPCCGVPLSVGRRRPLVSWPGGGKALLCSPWCPGDRGDEDQVLLNQDGGKGSEVGCEENYGRPPACTAETQPWKCSCLQEAAHFASSFWKQGSSTCVRSCWPRWTRHCTPRRRLTPWRCLLGYVKRCWASLLPQVRKGLGSCNPCPPASLAHQVFKAWASGWLSRDSCCWLQEKQG